MTNPRSLEAWYGLDPAVMSARERSIIHVIANYMAMARGGATTYEVEVGDWAPPPVVLGGNLGDVAQEALAAVRPDLRA